MPAKTKHRQDMKKSLGKFPLVLLRISGLTKFIYECMIGY